MIGINIRSYNSQQGSERWITNIKRKVREASTIRNVVGETILMSANPLKRNPIEAIGKKENINDNGTSQSSWSNPIMKRTHKALVIRIED